MTYRPDEEPVQLPLTVTTLPAHHLLSPQADLLQRAVVPAHPFRRSLPLSEQPDFRGVFRSASRKEDTAIPGCFKRVESRNPIIQMDLFSAAIRCNRTVDTPDALAGDKVDLVIRQPGNLLILPLIVTVDHLRRTAICSCNQNSRSEEHTSELQSRGHLVCRLLLEKKKTVLNTAPIANS